MPRPTTMNLSEAVAISASSLWAHKLRSVLTLIGVVIGVAAVIAVVSLINGANQYVATRVFRLGADVFGLSNHHHGNHRERHDQWPERQRSRRHPRTRLGHHHRLPLPVGFAFPAAQ